MVRKCNNIKSFLNYFSELPEEKKHELTHRDVFIQNHQRNKPKPLHFQYIFSHCSHFHLFWSLPLPPWHKHLPVTLCVWPEAMRMTEAGAKSCTARGTEADGTWPVACIYILPLWGNPGWKSSTAHRHIPSAHTCTPTDKYFGCTKGQITAVIESIRAWLEVLTFCNYWIKRNKSATQLSPR